MSQTFRPTPIQMTAAATSAVLFVIAVGCTGSATDSGAVRAASRAPQGERPDTCTRVSPEEDLQAAIERADPGAALCLAEGRHQGPLMIKKRLTLWGSDRARLENSGEDSTIRIGADRVELRGFRIQGSGRRYTKQDAGVFLQGADDVVIEGVTMRDVLFGISAQTANRLTIRGNDIQCRGERELGMRGDGIRFWEVRRSRVVDNRIDRCRDVVVWYAPENYFARNRVTDGRYGMHFMYSSRNIVEDSVFLRNSVGTFIMYSRHIHLDHNVLAASGGSSGMGLGLKESGALEIIRNDFADNAKGMYVDKSPLDPSNGMLFALNRVHLNDVGILFHNEPKRTTIRRNSFRSNGDLMRIQGGGSADTADWSRNYFGEYAGYDFDEDGIGDIPFEHRSLSQTLTASYPNLQFLARTPAMYLTELATEVVPLYQPTLLMRDREPRMAAPTDVEIEQWVEPLLDEHGEFPIREAEALPLVDPPATSLSKDY